MKLWRCFSYIKKSVKTVINSIIFDNLRGIEDEDVKDDYDETVLYAYGDVSIFMQGFKRLKE